jgi:hypothetical protein
MLVKAATASSKNMVSKRLMTASWAGTFVVPDELGDATAAVVDPPRFPTGHAQTAPKLGAAGGVEAADALPN